MMLAEWLFPDESKAVVPAPSSKAQSAIGLVATCPSAVHPKPSRQTDVAPVRTRLAAPNVRVPIRGIGLSGCWMLESGCFSFWPLIGLDYFFDNFKALFQLPYLRFFPFQFYLELLVQPLYRRQRHAVGVHHRDMFVVHTHVERGIKILS